MGAKLFCLGAAGTLIAGGIGIEAYRVDQDPTVILTPVEAKELPKEKPIVDALATFVCDSSIEVENCTEQNMLGSTSAGRHEFVELKDISPFAIEAFKFSEDKNFDKHFGADGRAIVRAGIHNIIASVKSFSIKNEEGASTITAMDSRWRYGLPHATNFLEKKHEAEIAMGLEIALEKPCRNILGIAEIPETPVPLPGQTTPEAPASQTSQTNPSKTQNTYPPEVYAEIRKCVKDQIMTDVLNRAYEGRGAYGIQEGSLQAFGKTADKLTQPQAIYEIAVLQAPSDSDLVSNTPKGLAEEINIVHKRYDEIVRDLYENGRADKAKEKELLDAFDPMIANDFIPFVPLGGINTAPAKINAAEHATVRGMSEAAGILGISEEELAAGGYKIILTIDPHAQAVAADIARLADNNTAGYELAMTAIDKSGGVISMVGGLDRSKSKVNLATGKAGGGSGRNLGSSNKHVIVAEAVEQGHTANDVIHIDADAKGHGTYTMVGADNGKDYTIDTGDSCKKYYKHSAPCDVSIYDGTAASDNVLFAHLLGEQGTKPQYGSKRVYEILRGLGSDIQGDPVASVVVGSGDGSTYGQALVARNMYLNGGKSGEAHLVEKIMDSSGKIVYDYATLPVVPGKQIITPQVDFDTTQIMRAPIEGEHGTAHIIQTKYGTPPNTVVGKTGTAPRSTDEWFNGAASDNERGGVAFSFWVGNPDKPTPLPKEQSSTDVAELAGAYITGIGAAIDGSQFPTQPA